MRYRFSQGVSVEKNISLTIVAATVLSAAMISLLAIMQGASAAPVASTVERVIESDVARQAESTPPTKDWVVYTRAGTPDSAASFRTGPATPTLGTGSLQLTTVTGTEKVYAFNYDHVGKPLRDVNDVSYNTYRSAGSLQQVAALNVQIDYNGAADGGFTTLVFEPVYNTNQGAVVTGQWQDWIASGSGIWWSTRSIDGQCAGATATCYKTWSEIVDNNPDATVLAVGINQGSGNPGLTTSVDAFTFDEVTYDFERYAVATGEILSPTNGQVVSGTLTLAATYDDADPDFDPVQWAVRKGTCSASTGTVAGNVDGKNDVSSWDGANFSASLNVSEYDSGQYCFVFNPTDEPGQNNVRETVTFSIVEVAADVKEDCKENGWQSFATDYKNQGQCVASVTSNDKSKFNR
jgi:hypothetical protein